MRGQAADAGFSDRPFRWSRPSREEVLHRLEASAFEPPSLKSAGDFDSGGHPGFIHDGRSIRLGSDEACWQRAREALRSWRMFEQPPLELIGGHDPPEAGRTVAILLPLFGVWWMSLSRVVKVFDEADETLERFGFVYATLRQHAVCGEERFEIRRNRQNGEIVFRIEAFSRPSRWYLWLGYPLTRFIQKRFARGALSAMSRAVAVGCRPEFETED